MSSQMLLILIVGLFIQGMYDIFITDRLSKAEAKNAKYNCDNCRNFECYYHYCEKKRFFDKIGNI